MVGGGEAVWASGWGGLAVLGTNGMFFLATNFHELTRIREFHEWGGIVNSA